MRYPIKTSAKEFCDTIATNIAQYEKYRCWASKGGTFVRSYSVLPSTAPHQMRKTARVVAIQDLRASDS